MRDDDKAWYFKQCEENREMLADVFVTVPIRPESGLSSHLARMLSVWYGEGTAYDHLNDNMGGFIQVTRANMAYKFVTDPPLKQNGEPIKYLLMIDNDMEPPINLPYLLCRHGKDVVGSPATSMSNEHGPQLCFTVLDTNGEYRFPCMRSGKKIPMKGLKEVGHVGTGALLVSRDALERFRFEIFCEGCGYVFDTSKPALKQLFSCPECKSSERVTFDIPFFVPIENQVAGMSTGIIGVGEDIAFCNQLRKKGVTMYVDMEAHVGHRKSIVLSWDESMRDDAIRVEDWVLPPTGKIIESR